MHKVKRDLRSLILKQFNHPSLATNQKINQTIEELIYLVAIQNDNITLCNIYDEDFLQ